MDEALLRPGLRSGAVRRMAAMRRVWQGSLPVGPRRLLIGRPWRRIRTQCWQGGQRTRGCVSTRRSLEFSPHAHGSARQTVPLHLAFHARAPGRRAQWANEIDQQVSRCVTRRQSRSARARAPPWYNSASTAAQTPMSRQSPRRTWFSSRDKHKAGFSDSGDYCP